MYFIGQFIGALLGTLLLSRLAFLALRKMPKSMGRLLWAYGLTLGFEVLVAGFLMPEDHRFNPVMALKVYLLPVLICLAVEYFVMTEGRREAEDKARKAAKRAAMGD